MDAKMTFYFDREGKRLESGLESSCSGPSMVTTAEWHAVLMPEQEVAVTTELSAGHMQRRLSETHMPRKLGEVVFAAFSIGLTLGAMLIAFVHGVSVPSATVVETTSESSYRVQALPVHATSREIKWDPVRVPPSITTNQTLFLPRFEMLMYEAGVYSSYQSALAAKRDYKKSGVESFVYPQDPYPLLLGPTVSLHHQAAFDAWLAKAEVPFYIRAFSLPARTVSFSTLSGPVRATIEQMLLLDVQTIQGLIAETSQFGAPQVAVWSKMSAVDNVQSQSTLQKMGNLGVEIERFHEAVLHAEQSLTLHGPKSSVAEMDALLQAVQEYVAVK